MITHLLNQTFRKISYVTNVSGDLVKTATTYYLCRFRYITLINKGANQESLDSQAQIWFEPEANILEGDIGEVDGKMWRINKLIKARKMDSSVRFLKTEVYAYELPLVS